ncbi:MAG: hypothetical protein ABSF70_14260 [Terracidiphilus sp.]|jgi:hypothetical protein
MSDKDFRTDFDSLRTDALAWYCNKLASADPAETKRMQSKAATLYQQWKFLESVQPNAEKEAALRKSMVDFLTEPPQ